MFSCRRFNSRGQFIMFLLSKSLSLFLSLSLSRSLTLFIILSLPLCLSTYPSFSFSLSFWCLYVSHLCLSFNPPLSHFGLSMTVFLSNIAFSQSLSQFARMGITIITHADYGYDDEELSRLSSEELYWYFKQNICMLFIMLCNM